MDTLEIMDKDKLIIDLSKKNLKLEMKIIELEGELKQQKWFSDLQIQDLKSEVIILKQLKGITV